MKKLFQKLRNFYLRRREKGQSIFPVRNEEYEAWLGI